MKFPFDFSLSLIFRLVFPGVVLAIVLWPVIAVVLHRVGLAADSALALPIAAVVFGWLVVLADRAIYILYEGRRWWPRKLAAWARSRQQRRLENAAAKAKELTASKDASAVEYHIQTLDFPINDDGERYAAYPTRLGNILTAFETYSDTAYGIDSIFYWYRLWLMLDKDLRALLDETQSIADGALYVSFSLCLGAIVGFGYAMGGTIVLIAHWRLFDLPDLPSPAWTFAIAIALLALSYGIYRLGLVQQRNYGEFYRSLFDQFRDKLDFADAVANLAVSKGAARQYAIKNKYAVASLYLRWNRVRPLDKPTLSPQAWAKAAASPPPPSSPPPKSP